TIDLVSDSLQPSDLVSETGETQDDEERPRLFNPKVAPRGIDLGIFDGHRYISRSRGTPSAVLNASGNGHGSIVAPPENSFWPLDPLDRPLEEAFREGGVESRLRERGYNPVHFFRDRPCDTHQEPTPQKGIGQ
ncbi:hypothetical protein BaRGS_00010532, partial [Batillaria attramentaria]